MSAMTLNFDGCSPYVHSDFKLSVLKTVMSERLFDNDCNVGKLFTGENITSRKCLRDGGLMHNFELIRSDSFIFRLEQRPQ